MAIPRQMGVRSDSMKFRVLELSISVICLALFIACFKIFGWAEEGIIPYVCHEFGCEIAVFTITLAVIFMGMQDPDTSDLMYTKLSLLELAKFKRSREDRGILVPIKKARISAIKRKCDASETIESHYIGTLFYASYFSSVDRYVCI
ncbi:hypothetical protein AVEN_92536-1 [Araneus ventricosus]|uniref:Uncharacterized protein n=1 Tax=Araneus ventricosus TaxID=182803 RepID=A0A4Y2AK48_ARAVE|nr:hypothetical protein AVEN_92536-1 [Araneus ventricosus]